ncbi:carotenoid oxygenase [Nitzschia inconspicua]|uniref:Carotenoid oxygenase n=1 Tax=Nitzschia inconspicua TaxID=303405 RepID=A0A9K3L1H0_9STRA|nr:carotenoid oxygenase [Nitzschia inconspicua]
MNFSELLSLFGFVLTSTSSRTSVDRHEMSSPFWEDDERVTDRCGFDQPPPEILEQIRRQPWRGGLEPVPPEGITLHEAKVVKGRIPRDLKGMLCRNGPGRIRIGPSQYGHWFDGDGLVQQLVIDGENQIATFQAKYVETTRFKAQQEMMKRSLNWSGQKLNRKIPFCKPGAWTKRGMGKWIDNIFAIPTNPSNTNVLFLPPRDGDIRRKVRLYALAEGGDPVEMDSESLETLGAIKIHSLDGKEQSVSFFSAHYTKDPITEDIYNHGLSLFPPALNVMKLDKNGWLVKQALTRLSTISFVHDSVVSEHFLLALLPPYSVGAFGLITSLIGGDPLGKQFKWNAQEENETRALVFSKETCQCVAEIPVPLLSSYHLVDAFEQQNDDNESLLTFRVLEHEPSKRVELEKSFADLYRAENIPLCTMVEYTMDLNERKVKARKVVAPDALPCELPDVNSSSEYRKRYCYTNCRQTHSSFSDSIQRIDMETGECSHVVSFGNGVYASAPTFIPKAKAGLREDDGYLILNAYDSLQHLSKIYILDASTMKELTELQLNCHVPYQFHGAWLHS